MRWSVTGDWLITSDFPESTCGGGRPLPLFRQNRKREVIHTRRHNNDYLMLRRPLTNE
jgi:hypothetical protein